MSDQEKSPIRVALLIGTPLTEQNFERFGIPYLSLYFEVIVFDCLHWVGRDSNSVKCKRVNWGCYITIKNESDFDQAAKTYKPNFAIDFIGQVVASGFSIGKVQEILRKDKVIFVVPQIGVLPLTNLGKRIIRFLTVSPTIKHGSAVELQDTVICKKKTQTWLNSILAIKYKINYKLKQLIVYRKYLLNADIRLLAGNKALDFATKKASKIIWIGLNDFHLFNKAKIENKRVYEKGAFILFIDDALPFASDWKLLKTQPPVTPSRYYRALCDFFEKIELHYGLPIVIAGHPNSKIDNSYMANVGGRPVYFEKTATLSLESNFVLIHGSTATSFAVLARKPTLFLTTRELDESVYGLHVRAMANSLARPLIFMDEPNNYEFGSSLLDFNESKYRQYELNYLRSEHSNESAPWQAFINYVQENY